MIFGCAFGFDPNSCPPPTTGRSCSGVGRGLEPALLSPWPQRIEQGNLRHRRALIVLSIPRGTHTALEFSGVLVKHTFLYFFSDLVECYFFLCPPSQLIINCMVAGHRWEISTGVGYKDKIGQQVAASRDLV